MIAFWCNCDSSSLQRRGRVAEPTHQIFTGQFSLYAGVLSGTSARVSYHGIGGNLSRLDGLSQTRHTTKPDYGSMQEQCMGLKEKDSCAGISPAPYYTGRRIETFYWFRKKSLRDIYGKFIF